MAKNEKYVTIRELALECGVSATTVSLALRDHPRISKATKIKVREVAERLGYRRHPMLAALMANLNQGKKPGSLIPVAVIYTQDPQKLRLNTFHNRVWGGMNERATELGFKIETFFPGMDGVSWKRLSDIFKARGISGIVMPPLTTPSMEIEMDWDSYSVVAIGYSMDKPDFHRVCPDPYHAIRTVMLELEKLGYHRIGLVLNQQSDLRSHGLLSSAFYGYQMSEGNSDFIPILQSESICKKELQAWHAKHKPDAIVSSDLEILKPLGECGLKYPDDVALVTLSGLEEGCEIAGIHQHAKVLGSAAIEKLAELMYYNRRGEPDLPRVLMIPSQWQADKSV